MFCPPVDAPLVRSAVGDHECRRLVGQAVRLYCDHARSLVHLHSEQMVVRCSSLRRRIATHAELSADQLGPQTRRAFDLSDEAPFRFGLDAESHTSTAVRRTSTVEIQGHGALSPAVSVVAGG